MRMRFGMMLLAALGMVLMTAAAHAKNNRYYADKAAQYFNGDDAPAAVKNMRANPRQNPRQNLRQNRAYDRFKNKTNFNEDRTVQSRKQHYKNKPRRGYSDNSSGDVND